MYSAVLLITLSLVFSRFTAARLAVWATLLVVLHAKLQYEETLLARRFKEYTAYEQRTKRLIPLVY
jgi:protein-S-isoprenylcysteine O-methyltransferase Ste14